MKICVRCFISGRVQGVFYRAATRKQALSMGLTGYARNLPDGRVEVLACGDEQTVTALRNWLWEGPPHAQVKDVQWQTVSEQNSAGFATV